MNWIMTGLLKTLAGQGLGPSLSAGWDLMNIG
jgi:hypothetical protein